MLMSEGQAKLAIFLIVLTCAVLIGALIIFGIKPSALFKGE